MQKNVAGQKWAVFAFDRTDNTPKTGDAAAITANLRIDGAAANAVDDVHPTELENGYYIFDITQAESNGNNILICPASSTANIQVVGVPGALWTVALQTGDAFAVVNHADHGNAQLVRSTTPANKLTVSTTNDVRAFDHKGRPLTYTRGVW